MIIIIVISDMKLEELAMIVKLKDGGQYKFLGVQENLKQEDKLVLKCAVKVYLKRVSMIWSSTFSHDLVKYLLKL